MPKRKAEVKKAAYTLGKLYLYIGITIIATSMILKYIVITYGGVWPQFTLIQVALDFYEVIGVAGVTLLAQTLFEVYRNRKD